LPSSVATAFVSYSHHDTEFVRRLVKDLQSAGVQVWRDEDIQAGEEWDASIHSALSRCTWLLAINSPAFLDSRTARDEIALALDLDKTVIPISYVDGPIYWRLKLKQLVDFRGDYENALTKLLAALGAKQQSTKRAPPRKHSRQHKPEPREPLPNRSQLQEVPKSASQWDRPADGEPLARMADEFSRAEFAAQFILSRTEFRPRVALVLGSGLGTFANDVQDAVRIPFKDIPFFQRSTAIGHAGALVVGNVNEVPVAIMQGRVHVYEGYSSQQVAFPVRVLGWMGINALVLTNAAGGINPSYPLGALVTIRDHINLQGGNPLVGPNDDRFGPRFPDMTDAYDVEFRRIAAEEAVRVGIEPLDGVYAAVMGPSYETPAEIRYLRTIGVDLVGMSTVPEVIAARHMKIRVLAISCVSNMAAGMKGGKITHEEVLEVGEHVQHNLRALLGAVLPRIRKYTDLPAQLPETGSSSH